MNNSGPPTNCVRTSSLKEEINLSQSEINSAQMWIRDKRRVKIFAEGVEIFEAKRSRGMAQARIQNGWREK